ncbi:hypothetical protein AYM40_09905 [Paraburkholderia phytofirmans OLGA172]|uniref:Uncharacterized protein n=1 Tax=Paraburkholderia phytofirmans OLGA172 TaxID=1417228 RepID=A0A161HNP6_9BURK|nr:hypothetical protein [Paraburkholderia phytofirmans]ANB72647.1 hypothetical protein AYM40_09905 [Paraburkholderia phytofirmans OLGA172]
MADDHEQEEFFHIRKMVLELERLIQNGDIKDRKKSSSATRLLAKADRCVARYTGAFRVHRGADCGVTRTTGSDCGCAEEKRVIDTMLDNQHLH